MSTLPRLPDAQVTAVEMTPRPIVRSVTGYGRKLPAVYRLRIGARWHRVYAICYSNTSTLYVLKQGNPLYLESETEYRLQMARYAPLSPSSAK